MPTPKRSLPFLAAALAVVALCGPPARAQSRVVPSPHEPDRYKSVPGYPDAPAWPAPVFRLSPHDGGVVMTHGGGPGGCDALGARDVYVFVDKGKYYMTYDGAGPTGWLVCLAESRDGRHWNKKGPLLSLGAPGQPDSASASYGVPYYDGKTWYMYYLATNKVSPAPDFVPIAPYHTLTATAPAPEGPWAQRTRLPGSAPLTLESSPGPVFRKPGGGYRMFFNGGVAEAAGLVGPWKVVTPVPEPYEACENQAIYYQASDKTWFSFTNHVGAGPYGITTDAIWVYWTRDPLHWESRSKAVVLDTKTCTWSTATVGLPSVVKVGDRLAIYYDGYHDSPGSPPLGVNHDVAIAWLRLPILMPK